MSSSGFVQLKTSEATTALNNQHAEKKDSQPPSHHHCQDSCCTTATPWTHFSAEAAPAALRQQLQLAAVQSCWLSALLLLLVVQLERQPQRFGATKGKLAASRRQLGRLASSGRREGGSERAATISSIVFCFCTTTTASTGGRSCTSNPQGRQGLRHHHHLRRRKERPTSATFADLAAASFLANRLLW